MMFQVARKFCNLSVEDSASGDHRQQCRRKVADLAGPVQKEVAAVQVKRRPHSSRRRLQISGRIM